jgi:hypothetical protein
MFFVLFRCAADDLVRDVEDRLRAAVVLLERDDLRAGKVFGKIHDVAEIRAAKRVDALRVVADDHDVIVRRGEQPHDVGLEAIGVLVFVDHDEAVGLGQPLSRRLVSFEQLLKLNEQIVVVEQPARFLILEVALP